mgnify:CR=1 FL=1
MALLATDVSDSSLSVIGLPASVFSVRFSVTPSMAVEMLFEPLLTVMPLMTTSASSALVAAMPEVVPSPAVLKLRMSLSDWSPVTVMFFTEACTPVSLAVSIRKLLPLPSLMTVARRPDLSSALIALTMPFSDVSPFRSIVRLVPLDSSISKVPVSPCLAVRSATAPDCRLWARARLFTVMVYWPATAPSAATVAVKAVPPVTLPLMAAIVSVLPSTPADFCTASSALCSCA